MKPDDTENGLSTVTIISAVSFGFPKQCADITPMDLKVQNCPRFPDACSVHDRTWFQHGFRKDWLTRSSQRHAIARHNFTSTFHGKCRGNAVEK